MSASFPLQGIAGIVGEGPGQVGEASGHGLSTVEIRADLLLQAGCDAEALMGVVADAKGRGLRVLFTVRHPSHGGAFDGDEEARFELNARALAAGADVVDAEHRSEPAAKMLAAGMPVILSHHDFESMPSTSELEALTREMEQGGPLGVKIVPTGRSLDDAATMLEWVADRAPGGPERIGFTMGAEGACSRILCISRGAPITYASFGAAVAPGQVPIAELAEIYACERISRHTRVFGILGTQCLGSLSPALHNPAFRRRSIDAVYVPLQTPSFDDLMAVLDRLGVDGLSVTIPYKERAAGIADEIDERSRRAGASNTLVFDRSGAARRVRAANTDFDGVLGPIRRHRPLRDLPVAVLGNGGAARGAVAALLESEARPKLFYRNPERGQPVADALGIEGAELDRIDARFEVFINATPLGTHRTDPSPVPASVFQRPDQIAFDMNYYHASSAFLDAARAAGAKCVSGGEMLVAQGTVQFEHFTGEPAELDEFQAYFDAGRRIRDDA